MPLLENPTSSPRPGWVFDIRCDGTQAAIDTWSRPGRAAIHWVASFHPWPGGRRRTIPLETAKSGDPRSEIDRRFPLPDWRQTYLKPRTGARMEQGPAVPRNWPAWWYVDGFTRIDGLMISFGLWGTRLLWFVDFMPPEPGGMIGWQKLTAAAKTPGGARAQVDKRWPLPDWIKP